jgi:hypothetical protein
MATTSYKSNDSLEFIQNLIQTSKTIVKTRKILSKENFKICVMIFKSIFKI